MSENFKITDEELIKQFQEGDEGAFEEIVLRYSGRLYNFAYRFLMNKEEAEDVVQDTFLKVYQKRHSYREIAKFSTWIYTITGNLAKTLLRKQRNRKMFSFSALRSEDREIDYAITHEVPETTLNSQFTEKIIQTAITKLPEHFRTAIILRDVQELSYDEISNIIGKPLGTIKSRINRARLRLQEILEEMNIKKD